MTEDEQGEQSSAAAEAAELDAKRILALANAPVPRCYSNWTLFAAGSPMSAMVEATMYTDTQILGEHEVGPLKFINTIAHDPRRVELRPAIVLRFACYWPATGYKPIKDTSDEHYHAGDHFDEAAALASLILGIRLQAGPITREFRPRGDPLGTPINLGGRGKSIPTLYPSDLGLMVPRVNQAANLVDLKTMKRLPLLEPAAASALIKAARAYQTALWFADSHPEMAWLFLVSAIEAAATFWARRHFADEEPFLPQAVDEILREHDCPGAVDAPMSAYLRKTTGATRKFIAFLQAFLPEPPTDRPEAEALKVSFDAAALKKDFEFIYKCRSRALHTGVPFPRAMCLPRHSAVNEERVIGLGMSSLGATWDFKKHRPLHFHLFEHITRGTLLRWFGALEADNVALDPGAV